MTQVLTNLLRGSFASLEDLPDNVRNDALLDLAKLASEGGLSGKINLCQLLIFFFFAADMQEKVFTELAQNLNSLPPQTRAKGNAFIEDLIKSKSFIRRKKKKILL